MLTVVKLAALKPRPTIYRVTDAPVENRRRDVLRTLLATTEHQSTWLVKETAWESGSTLHRIAAEFDVIAEPWSVARFRGKPCTASIAALRGTHPFIWHCHRF